MPRGTGRALEAARPWKARPRRRHEVEEEGRRPAAASCPAAPHRRSNAPVALAAVLAASSVGCGDANARPTYNSAPNLIVLNGTLRSQKVWVVRNEVLDLGDLGTTLDEVEPRSHGSYQVVRGEHTVISERYGHGHDPHRRAKLHFKSNMCHVVVLGPWPPVLNGGVATTAPSPEAIAASLCPPGTRITVTPLPNP
jgi:hypothetical protein